MIKNYEIQLLKKNQLETGKKLVLWGAGDLGELAFVALKQLGIKVNFFCDNNSEKQLATQCQNYVNYLNTVDIDSLSFPLKKKY